MAADGVVVPVRPGQYMLGLVILARYWSRSENPELLEWYLKSLRGELPAEKSAKDVKNYTVKHVFLPPDRYLAALAAFTTRLGVFHERTTP